MSEKCKWRCTNCGTEWTTEPDRHQLSHCPECGESWVDHEEAYIRRTIDVEPVEE